MTDFYYALRNLDELDFDNLVAGRFTKEALHEALIRVRGLHNYDPEELHHSGGFANTSERVLADELNDMLEAARHCHKHNYKWKDLQDA